MSESIHQGARMDRDVLARAVCRYSTITADEQSERVHRVIRSGALGAVGGTEVALLEQRVAAMVGRAGALAVSTATAGLDLVLRALGVGSGDEVIVPELSWISVGGSVWAVGADPVVAPVNWSLMPTWDEVEPLVGPARRAVVVAHMRGMVAYDVERIAAGLRRVPAARPAPGAVRRMSSGSGGGRRVPEGGRLR